MSVYGNPSGQYTFHFNLLFSECKLMREIRKIDNHLKSVCILIDQWLFCNNILQEKCDAIIIEIEVRRKKMNVATITGTSVGIMGTVISCVGMYFDPKSGSVATLLSVSGAVLAASGGIISSGAKVRESVLNRETIKTLNRYQNCYNENFESLKSVMDQLSKKLNNLGELPNNIRANQNLEASDFADIQSIPCLVRAVQSLIMIPLCAFKVSFRGICFLGGIFGPMTALVDASLLVFLVNNMAKGNETEVTKNLRRLSTYLYGSRRQMHNWAYGNEKLLNMF